MRIPGPLFEREQFYAELITKSFQSRDKRISVYDGLKHWYTWGQLTVAAPVEYNKLFAHIDLLTSFLFSGETTSFVVEIDESVDISSIKLETAKAKTLTPAVNKSWNRANCDLVFNEALTWALVYNTMFLKIIPRTRGYDIYPVEPHAIGVLLEHEPMMDKQPFIVHEFTMTRSDLERRIAALPQDKQDAIIASVNFTEQKLDTTKSLAPNIGVEALTIAATSPNIEGNVNLDKMLLSYDFDPYITEPSCMCCECWIWDDEKNDYRMALMLEGNKLLHDCESNPFVKDEQPLIKITPNQVYNYFWGRSELMYLIPIQKWINERIPEIKLHLQKQTDPPKSASGFQGYTEEKLNSLSEPGSMIFNADPINAKVDQHLPAPINVWEILDRADMMFAEVSGIRELMQGRGESGVRATSHANLLVRVGSSRVKKKAALIEDSVEKIGALALKIMMRNDKTHYKTEEEAGKEIEFVANQLTDNHMVKVDSHSSSPIFVEQQTDKAMILFKAGAIDREDLIDAVKPQNASMLKSKLREREKNEAAIRAKEAQAGIEKKEAPKS